MLGPHGFPNVGSCPYEFPAVGSIHETSFSKPWAGYDHAVQPLPRSRVDRNNLRISNLDAWIRGPIQASDFQMFRTLSRARLPPQKSTCSTANAKWYRGISLIRKRPPPR